MEHLKNFIIYNTAGITISGISFIGLEYMSDPSNFKQNMKTHVNNVKYWILDKIVSGYTLYKDVFPKSNKIDDKTSDINTLVYNADGNIIEKTSLEYKWLFERELIDSKEYFVRDYINNTCSDIKINDIFMSCEIINNSNTINITNEISKFCVSGIQIDKIFLKAFMKKFFNIELDNNFIMNFITNECNILSIDKNKKLTINNNNFEITDYLDINLNEEVSNEEVSNEETLI